MKETILLLLLTLNTGISYSQNDDVIVASLAGYCSGTVSKETVVNSPEIKLTASNPEATISKIGFFSKNKLNYVEHWTKGGVLNQKMLDRIATLNTGDVIYFDVYVNTGDTTILIHPLELKISTDNKRARPCYCLGIANISGITHGELTRAELLKAGRITISSDNKEIKEIRYKLVSVIRGEKKVVSCEGARFTPDIKRLINDSHIGQRVYFSDIKVLVDGKYYFMNPIEVQLK